MLTVPVNVYSVIQDVLFLSSPTRVRVNIPSMRANRVLSSATSDCRTLSFCRSNRVVSTLPHRVPDTNMATDTDNTKVTMPIMMFTVVLLSMFACSTASSRPSDHQVGCLKLPSGSTVAQRLVPRRYLG